MAVEGADAKRLKRAAARIRREAIADENTLRRELLPAWRRIQADLDERALALAQKIERAEQTGIDVSESWLHKQERYHSLLNQTQQRIAELTQLANQPVSAFQATLLERAADNARALVETALGRAGPQEVRSLMADWNHLAVGDTEAMVGMAGNGKPLGDLLDAIAPDSKLQARHILTRGIALGKNPRAVATDLRSVSEEAVRRLTTIARTEGLRAQRTATHASYLANDGLVGGWIWDAALDERTCEACIGEAGSEHPLTEEMESHICCRCQELPVTRSWDELGLGDLGLGETGISIETGPEWFARQGEDVQRTLLGPGKLEALNTGEIGWPDLITRVEGRNGWPAQRRAATLREALESAAAR